MNTPVVEFDIKNVTRDQWAGALALSLITGCANYPDVLRGIVTEGRKTFVERAQKEDKFGLTKDDYSEVWRKIARHCKRSGLLA